MITSRPSHGCVQCSVLLLSEEVSRKEEHESWRETCMLAECPPDDKAVTIAATLCGGDQRFHLVLFWSSCSGSRVGRVTAQPVRSCRKGQGLGHPTTCGIRVMDQLYTPPALTTSYRSV